MRPPPQQASTSSHHALEHPNGSGECKSSEPPMSAGQRTPRRLAPNNLASGSGQARENRSDQPVGTTTASPVKKSRPIIRIWVDGFVKCQELSLIGNLRILRRPIKSLGRWRPDCHRITSSGIASGPRCETLAHLPHRTRSGQSRSWPESCWEGQCAVARQLRLLRSG